MDLYPLFLLVAAAAIANPGPGVALTLSNSLRHGGQTTSGGIAGLAAGSLAVASLSAGGLGALLATSQRAFTAMKLLGAAYLLYLGIRLWRRPRTALAERPASDRGASRSFLDALTLQLTNPQAIAFFVAVFPPFIGSARDPAGRFALLALTYSALIVLIHGAYALLARRARRWLSTPRAGRALDRVAAVTFWVFGAALATARR